MPRFTHLYLHPCIVVLGINMALAPAAVRAEVHGSVVAGSNSSDARSGTFTEGMDKSPFGIDTPTGRVVLRADAAPFADFSASITAEADSQRDEVFDVLEAWVGWSPVPRSPWRTRVKAGAFFPVTSLEVEYDNIGWSPERTISAAAINSWIGEEIRVVGVELTQQWRGAMIDSPHTFTARTGLFGGNDPAGTQIAWRGWNLGARVTGLFQTLHLPDLPIYCPDGLTPLQTRNVKLFREIDGRIGLYASLGYAYSDRIELAALHYDNRGDPLQITEGQYSWHTRFEHLSLRLQPGSGWQVLSQWLRGSTRMGPDVVSADFASWYLLLSHPLGPGQASLRFDEFESRDRDLVPEDANSEDGHALAVAYSIPLPRSLRLVTEAMLVSSDRPARNLIGESPRRTERSLALQLRRNF